MLSVIHDAASLARHRIAWRLSRPLWGLLLAVLFGACGPQIAAISSTSTATQPLPTVRPSETPTHPPSLTPTLALTATSAQPAPATGMIAFTAYQAGNGDIYLLDLENRQTARLTHDPAEDHSPAWSPDRSQIAFTSNRNGDDDLYIMNADGSSAAQVTSLLGDESSVDWSPDGSRLVFVYQTDHDGAALYLLYLTGDLAGEPPVRLSEEEKYGGDYAPAWSPDGRRIAFGSDREGYFEVYVMAAPDSPGTGQPAVIRLTADPLDRRADDYNPAWSPDGSHIAFVSNRDGNIEIYVMDADGEGQESAIRLTDDPDDNFEPDWSPDGRWLCFVSGTGITADDVNTDIDLISADGTGVMRLTDDPYFILDVAWRPVP